MFFLSQRTCRNQGGTTETIPSLGEYPPGWNGFLLEREDEAEMPKPWMEQQDRAEILSNVYLR